MFIKKIYKSAMILNKKMHSSMNIFKRYKEKRVLYDQNINEATTPHFHYGKLIA